VPGAIDARFVKIVKPKRFKDAEFSRIMRNAMRRAVRQIRKDFELTTKTWEHEVVFKEHTHLTKRTPSPAVSVTTDDEIYGYVNNGTRPHEIWAGIYTGKSEAKVLAFPSMFAPKTKVGVIHSWPGMSGGETVFRPYVQHPGTEAREFDKVIREEREPWFKSQMEKAMSVARKSSGHPA